mgnify:CR=1 FL=1
MPDDRDGKIRGTEEEPRGAGRETGMRNADDGGPDHTDDADVADDAGDAGSAGNADSAGDTDGADDADSAGGTEGAGDADGTGGTGVAGDADGAGGTDGAGDAGDDDDGTDGEEADDGPAAGRRWIRNTVAALLALALIVNILALLPRIHNAETLPLLFRSRELSEREAVRTAMEAVALIVTDRGRGSGFHLSDGYILTNHHVVEDVAWIIAEFPESRRFPAEVAATDPELDVALLRADIGKERLPSIAIDRNWEPGETVYVVGNPLHLERIAASGSILGTVRIQGRRAPVMIVDAPVHRGNSGSPVVNERGRAVAVIYATGEVLHQGESVQAGFAVPLGELDDLLRERLPGLSP